MKDPNRVRKGEIHYNISLNEEQIEAKRLIRENQIVVITGRAGCLGKDTKVLMYDGTLKNSQDVKIGDQLMGVDSTPRTVLELFNGRDQMYVVNQANGNSYRVNELHTLSLKKVKSAVYSRITVNGKRIFDYTKLLKEKEVTTVNMTITEYLALPSKKKYKGYTSPALNFNEKQLSISPYYMGLWLGDGNKSCIREISTNDYEIENYLISLNARKTPSKYKWSIPTNRDLNNAVKHYFNVTDVSKIEDKFIPRDYLFNSKHNRLQLLAGILDSDGHYVKVGKYYDITLKDKRLAENVVFLSKSLGYRTNQRRKIATMKRKDGSIYSCEVYRISIIPTDIIPCLIQRKQNRIGSDFKNRSHVGITVVKDVVDDYYGFRLDGDNLFILEDFTVTHNCGKSLVSAQSALDFLFKKECDKIFVTRATIEVGNSLGYLPGSLEEKFNPYLEAFQENLTKCYDELKIQQLVKDEKIQAYPVQFIRGKTIEDVLIVEESQNLSKGEMLAILTRLGKTGKIIINGDNEQCDTKSGYTGLSYVIELSKKIDEIKWIKLKHNHRSDLVGKILETEYGK